MPKSHSKGSLDPAPKLLLAVDPGKSTGWAVFKGNVIFDMGITRTVDEFSEWLDKFLWTYGANPDTIVYEDFQLFKNKALQQSGSRMEATQVIGIIKHWGRQVEAEMIRQPASILPIAQKFSKMKMPSNHRDSHHISAANHAYYYLVTNNMILPNGIQNG